MIKRIFLSLSLCLLLLTVRPAAAQTTDPPPGPVYIVQAGDSLWAIAVRFNVSLTELKSYNNLLSEDIFIGSRLVIPGMEDMSGILATETVALGETLRSLSRQQNIDPELVMRLNRIVSPAELYTGYELILLEQEGETPPNGSDTLKPGETLLELAIRQGTTPWSIASANKVGVAVTALPGDYLSIPNGKSDAASRGFPPAIASLSLSPLPITQGQTVQISLTLNQETTPGGFLVDHPLHFFSEEAGTWIALQGVHAMLDPGLYPLRIDLNLPDGTSQSFEQMVLVGDGYFRQDPLLVVDPYTIDPAVTEPENEMLYALVAPAIPQRYWQGMFRLPVDEYFCVRSMYGNRRSYNGSDFIYFHSGVDYGICSESHPYDIYAPAAGVVIFTGLLAVRGNATVIDHGWGIYTGYWHQEEIYVQAGDRVEAGQLIGMIGGTGRATGPHLHWEVWANGVQVNPLQWLDEVFPIQNP